MQREIRHSLIKKTSNNLSTFSASDTRIAYYFITDRL